MRKPLLFAALLLALVACKSKPDAASPTIDFGAGDGFSHFDAGARPNGTQDPTDWTTDASWNEQEKALFPKLSFELNGAQRPTLFMYANVYPNPGASAIYRVEAANKSGSLAVSYSVKLVLVNRAYEVLMQQGPLSFPSGYAVAFDYGQLGLQPGERYRLYYVLYDSNGLVSKGHGDVRYDK